MAKGFLLDMDGVIYSGDDLIPGADKFIAKLKRQKIELRVAMPGDFEVMGDEKALQQVFLNVIINAEQAFPPSQDNKYIEISADSNGGRAYISVKDNGVGIHEKDIPKIFKRFLSVFLP